MKCCVCNRPLRSGNIGPKCANRYRIFNGSRFRDGSGKTRTAEIGQELKTSNDTISFFKKLFAENDYHDKNSREEIVREVYSQIVIASNRLNLTEEQVTRLCNLYITNPQILYLAQRKGISKELITLLDLIDTYTERNKGTYYAN